MSTYRIYDSEGNESIPLGHDAFSFSDGVKHEEPEEKVAQGDGHNPSANLMKPSNPKPKPRFPEKVVEWSFGFLR